MTSPGQVSVALPHGLLHGPCLAPVAPATESPRLARLISRLSCHFVLVLGICSTPGLAAQSIIVEEARIVGSVLEARTGLPVTGVMVTLSREVGGEGVFPEVRGSLRVGTSFSDMRGQYEFSGMSPGRYRVRMDRIGFEGTEFWVELGGSERLRRSVRLYLDPVPLQRLRVAVPQPPRGLTQSLSRSAVSPSRERIDAVPATWVRLDAVGIDPLSIAATSTLGEPDLFRALQRLPGVSGRGDFAASFWVRGSPWGLTQVMLDGLPLYNPVHGGGLATGIQAETLGRITLFPGVRPPSLARGAAATLVLEADPAEGSKSFSVGVSTAAVRGRAEARVASDRIGLAVSARRSWWDLVAPGVDAPKSGAAAVEYYFWDISTRIDVRLTKGLRLDAGGLVEEDRLDGSVTNLIGDSYGRWGNRLGWMSVRQELGSLFGRVYLGRTSYALETRPGPGSTMALSTIESRLVIAKGHIKHTVRRLELGGDHLSGAFAWQVGTEAVEEELGQRTLGASVRQLPGRDTPAHLSRSRSWAEASLTLGHFLINLGSGFDSADGQVKSASGWSPSVSAGWTAGSVRIEASYGKARQTVYPIAGVGRSFGPELNAGHLWAMADSIIPALVSDTWTISSAFEFRPGLAVKATVFKRRITGVWMDRVWGISGGEFRLAMPKSRDEAGTEAASGVELSITDHSGGVTGSVSITRTFARLEGAEGLEWPSPSDRLYSFNSLVLGHLSEDLSLGGSLTIESGWPVVSGRSVKCTTCGADFDGEVLVDPIVSRARAYGSLDFLVDWRRQGAHFSWGITASLRNITGRDNQSAHGLAGCASEDLFSLTCSGQPGPGSFSSGLTSPTPTVAFRVVF